MAFDKVVDSAVLDAGLKAIADAIRAKAGTSGNMAFPTAMAEAIAAIEAGGGGSGGGVQIKNGTITFNSANGSATITHDLGVLPDLIIVRTTTTYMSDTSCIAYYIGNRLGGRFNPNSQLSTYYITGGKSSTYSATVVEMKPTIEDFTSSEAYIVCSVNKTKFTLNINGYTQKWKPGEVYNWYVVGG